MLHAVQTVEIAVGLVCAVAAVLWYGLRARWWASEMGRHLWSYSAVVALLLGLLTVRRLAGDYRGHEVVSTVGLGLLDWVVAWRLLLLVRELSRGRHSRRGVR